MRRPRDRATCGVGHRGRRGRAGAVTSGERRGEGMEEHGDGGGYGEGRPPCVGVGGVVAPIRIGIGGGRVDRAGSEREGIG